MTIAAKRSLAAGIAAIAFSLAVAAQTPPPAPQNPSPMVETTRSHARREQRPPRGERTAISWGGAADATLFVPRSSEGSKSLDLLIHFHGAAWLPEIASKASPQRLAVATVHLGAGSSVYRNAFSEPARFEAIVAESRKAFAPRSLERVFLSGFSAGFGAIREILRNGGADAVDGILLLDGLHASYVPERTVLAEGGALDESALKPFAEFARLAAAGKKAFVITHSEIFPGTFASTTETTDALIAALGLSRTAVLEWGPGGMQQLSEVSEGGLKILGFAGNSAPDHVDHFHAMPEFVSMLLNVDR